MDNDSSFYPARQFYEQIMKEVLFNVRKDMPEIVPEIINQLQDKWAQKMENCKVYTFDPSIADKNYAEEEGEPQANSHASSDVCTNETLKTTQADNENSSNIVKLYKAEDPHSTIESGCSVTLKKNKKEIKVNVVIPREVFTTNKLDFKLIKINGFCCSLKQRIHEAGARVIRDQIRIQEIKRSKQVRSMPRLDDFAEDDKITDDTQTQAHNDNGRALVTFNNADISCRTIEDGCLVKLTTSKKDIMLKVVLPHEVFIAAGLDFKFLRTVFCRVLKFRIREAGNHAIRDECMRLFHSSWSNENEQYMQQFDGGNDRAAYNGKIKKDRQRRNARKKKCTDEMECECWSSGGETIDSDDDLSSNDNLNWDGSGFEGEDVVVHGKSQKVTKCSRAHSSFYIRMTNTFLHLGRVDFILGTLEGEAHFGCPE